MAEFNNKKMQWPCPKFITKSRTKTTKPKNLESGPQNYTPKNNHLSPTDPSLLPPGTAAAKSPAKNVNPLIKQRKKHQVRALWLRLRWGGGEVEGGAQGGGGMPVTEDT